MNNKLTIYFIVGGTSVEHESSLISTRYILEVLNSHYTRRFIGIAKTGKWIREKTARKTIENNSRYLISPDNKDHSKEVISELLKNPENKLVFPLLNGKQGEDGAIIALLDLLNLPYIGNRYETYLTCFNKLNLRLFCKENNIPYPEYQSFTKGENITPDNIKFKFPYFIKPVTGGSSIGASLVKEEGNLQEAVKKAFEISRTILIEKSVDEIREIEILLSGKKPKIEYVGEAITKNSFQDYEAKLSNKRKLIAPAHISVDLYKELTRIALNAYRKIGLESYARVDFFVNRSTKEFYLAEITTVPGFNKSWRYFKYMDNLDGFRQFIERIVRRE